MLADRPYMRDDYPKEKTSVLTWLLCAIFGAFILEYVLFSSSSASQIQIINDVALTIRGLSQWHVWTFATYWLLHDASNLLHVVSVLLALYALGRELTPLLGNRRVVSVFAGSILLGGLVWAAVNWRTGGTLMGATAGVYGLLALYAALYPNREFSFLVFFFFPVTLKPKHLAITLLGVDLLILAVYEFPHARLPFSYAPSAHLGGMLAGWIYFRYIYQPDWALFRPRTELELPKWMKRGPKSALPAKPPAPPPRSETMTSDRATLRAEVDRILDKINSHGFGSLSADEKRLLDEAKDLLSRR